MLRPLNNWSRKAKVLAAAAAISVVGGVAVLAQTVDGLDLQAVLSRGEAADPDAEALVREVARRGEEMREDAKSAADCGNRNLRDNKGILGGGPAGPIDFDQMLQASDRKSTRLNSSH